MKITNKELAQYFGLTEHPVFSTKKEANEWVKEYSEESYKNDKEFCNSYIQ